MTTATVRETEAEAVAFIVGQAIGLEMGNASSDYIQMYAGNAALLAESLEVIQRTSSIILGAIRPEETGGSRTVRSGQLEPQVLSGRCRVGRARSALHARQPE